MGTIILGNSAERCLLQMEMVFSSLRSLSKPGLALPKVIPETKRKRCTQQVQRQQGFPSTSSGNLPVLLRCARDTREKGPSACVCSDN